MVRRKINKAPLLWMSLAILILLFGVIVLRKSVPLPCANSLSCDESLEFMINNDEMAVFNGSNFQPPRIDVLGNIGSTRVLGDSDNLGDKHIYVDLSTQTLKAYDGTELYFETKVSTGKWYSTPTGDFKIWKMIRSTKMSGGEGADYYYLPNVPYVMFFSNSEVAPGRGFALHGAYWHNNFGHAMSHGCINMRTIDAKKIYEWIGTDDSAGSVTITIYGKVF